jgi:uncharacterized membrane protein (UPF0127 family)
MTLIKTRQNRPTLSRLLATAALIFQVSAFAQGQPQNLPTVTLKSGMHNIVAQVARTPEQRSAGLMYRQQMPAHEGMVFIFDSPATQCFWMRNTLIPLSAAFLADDGSIVNIEDMAPLKDDSHCSRKPVRYVLEMNQGWFARLGLKTGDKLSGPLFVR